MYTREISIDDCANLSALSIYVWLNTYASQGIDDKVSHYVLNEFSPEKFRHIAEYPGKGALLVLDDDNLVGVAVVDLDSRYRNSADFGFEIKNLYIHPSFHRQGLGRNLLKSVQTRYGGNSWLTAWIHNEPALKFYKSNDYNIVGEAEFNLSGEIHINHVLSNRPD